MSPNAVAVTERVPRNKIGWCAKDDTDLVYLYWQEKCRNIIIKMTEYTAFFLNNKLEINYISP